MNTATRDAFGNRYAMCAGALDLLTGLALVAAPAFTLGVMGAPAPGGEALLFVRFVGVFVAAVGASYLWAAWFAKTVAFRLALQLTLFFRAGAGVFASVAVATTALPMAWIAVAITDLLCVAIQVWLLTTGVGRDASA